MPASKRELMEALGAPDRRWVVINNCSTLRTDDLRRLVRAAMVYLRVPREAQFAVAIAALASFYVATVKKSPAEYISATFGRKDAFLVLARLVRLKFDLPASRYRGISGAEPRPLRERKR